MILDIVPFKPREQDGSASPELLRFPPRRTPKPAVSVVRTNAEPVTIPLIPRAVAHLPNQRWRWSARRRMGQDHPYGRIARIEENLQRLVGTLEAEVDRLVAETGQLLGDNR